MYWQALAAAKARWSTPAERRLACLDQIQVSDTAPFSWDIPIEGGLPEFTWTCPGCGGVSGGVLGDPSWAGRWGNAGTELNPTIIPDLPCLYCHARWALAGGLFTCVRSPGASLAAAPA